MFTLKLSRKSRGAVMLTTLTTFREPWQAHLLRTRLEAEGIPASVAHDQHIWVNWPISNAIGGAKVQIPGDEIEHARQVMDRCASGHYKAELVALFGDLDDVACSNCGSQDLRRPPKMKQIILGISCALIGWPVRMYGPRYHCRKCGAQWDDPDY